MLNRLSVSVAFVERNFALIRRYLGWEIVFISYSVANALAIGFIGVRFGSETVLYLIIGAMVWGFLSLLFHEVSESVAWERWEGTIEYTFMAPVPRIVHLLGTASFAVIYGVLRSLLLLGVLALTFGLIIPVRSLLIVALILFSSGLSFIGMGLIAAVLPLLSPEKGAPATHIFEALLLLISGVYYETDVLPPILRFLSQFSPATYTIRALRAVILSGAGISDLYPTILLLLIVGLIMIPIGNFIFMLAENHARRSGKLKRGG
ncbi:ABC transporter permease [candidate division WOR-3 bacterium]|uniref:Transport permease protein n=1 Tax=candidate division WOR-3 bacterium TaxID=2052148 RepID=A0A660SFI0_UNCW3|nr:MAG: ABC transporter permease [candidate division WOR-3 bacterium]